MVPEQAILCGHKGLGYKKLAYDRKEQARVALRWSDRAFSQAK